MTVKNQSRKKYVVVAGGHRHFLESGEMLTLDADAAAIKRIYSKNSVLNFFIVLLMVAIYLAFVFFETSADENKASLIRVSYRVKSTSDKPLNLVILNSSFLNVEKDAPADEAYKVNCVYYAAHILSIALCTLLTTALFFTLAYFGFTGKNKTWGVVCSLIGAGILSIGIYSLVKSGKNLKTLLTYLKKYYKGILDAY